MVSLPETVIPYVLAASILCDSYPVCVQVPVEPVNLEVMELMPLNRCWPTEVFKSVLKLPVIDKV